MRRPALALCWTLTFAAAAGALTAAPEARAQSGKRPGGKDPKIAEAKRLFEQGSDAYHDGRYEEAIKAWEKSYELSGKALIFESIASAYERLGERKRAREYLAKWRAEAPKAEHEQLDARLKNLDARIAAAEAEEEKKKAEEEKKKAAQAGADKAAQDEAKSRGDARSTRLALGIAGAGAGVLAAGAGVVLGVVAAGQRPDASAVCASGGGKTLCKASAKDAIESSSTLALAGDITWIAGAVLAATGGVLLLTLPAAPAEKGAPAASAGRWVSVTPIVTPTGGGVGIGGAF